MLGEGALAGDSKEAAFGVLELVGVINTRGDAEVVGEVDVVVQTGIDTGHGLTVASIFVVGVHVTDAEAGLRHGSAAKQHDCCNKC